MLLHPHAGAVAIRGWSFFRQKQTQRTFTLLIAYGQAASKTNAVGSTGGSVTLNWDNSNIQTLTLTSNITTLTKSNPIDGAVYTLFLTQGATGGIHGCMGNRCRLAGRNRTNPVYRSRRNRRSKSLIYIAGVTGYYGNANLNFS
jgi:hypothetical protein